jgi:hypothetical protein
MTAHDSGDAARVVLEQVEKVSGNIKQEADERKQCVIRQKVAGGVSKILSWGR